MIDDDVAIANEVLSPLDTTVWRAQQITDAAIVLDPTMHNELPPIFGVCGWQANLQVLPPFRPDCGDRQNKSAIREHKPTHGQSNPDACRESYHCGDDP
jgi:hypothetical protein